MALIERATRMLEKALPGLGAETEAGQAVMKSIASLSKHVPEGTTSPGIQQTAMQNFLMQLRQNAPQQGVLAALGQGGAAPGGAPPAPPPRPIPTM